MTARIHISKFHSLNKDMLHEAFRFTATPRRADMCIAWNNNTQGVKLSKTIMCQGEPPITSGRQWIYNNLDRYHTVLRFDPDPDAPNQFAMSEKTPHLWPYMPALSQRLPPNPDGKGVHFAGRQHCPTGNAENVPDIIYDLRTRIAQNLKDMIGGTCYGHGWPDTTKPMDNPGEWHQQKYTDIKTDNPMFALNVENCRMRQYISEKFWDGLLSGRVPVYLGAPDITKYIPSTAFIDLSVCYIDKKRFDFDRMREIIDNFAKNRLLRERMIDQAGKQADLVGSQAQQAKDDATTFVINRIKNSCGVA